MRAPLEKGPGLRGEGFTGTGSLARPSGCFCPSGEPAWPMSGVRRGGAEGGGPAETRDDVGALVVQPSSVLRRATALQAAGNAAARHENRTSRQQRHQNEQAHGRETRDGCPHQHPAGRDRVEGRATRTPGQIAGSFKKGRGIVESNTRRRCEIMSKIEIRPLEACVGQDRGIE